MRDPSRIDYYCDELADLWHKVPDWRLGQFMMNMLRAWSMKTHIDPFYVEDNEFMIFMKKYMEGFDKK